MKLGNTGYKPILNSLRARGGGVETLHMDTCGSMAFLAGKVAHTAVTVCRPGEAALQVLSVSPVQTRLKLANK